MVANQGRANGGSHAFHLHVTTAEQLIANVLLGVLVAAVIAIFVYGIAPA